MNITSNHIKALITEKADGLGFFKTGFAKYEVLEDESKKLRRWLDAGFGAEMAWIERGFEKRKDVRNILPNAKSVISLAYNYFTPYEHDESKPKISRYAWGKDYHKILKPKLKKLCAFIEGLCHCEERSDEAIPAHNEIASLPLAMTERIKAMAYVDDGPVMDKVWAQKAGIGWMGKHTNIINPEYGSWFFLCTVITDIEFDTYSQPVEDSCGSCSLCVSACPTGAITSEYVVDSNKCISYQTIENRNDIPPELNIDGWIFGCDVCQDVCPHNSPKYNHVSTDESFSPISILSGSEGSLASKEQLSSITEQQFTEAFSSSPIKRTKYKGWKRNLERIK